MFKQQFEGRMIQKAKEQHTREEMAIIWVIQQLNVLNDVGMVEGRPFVLTERGERIIEGFELTDDEMEAALNHIRAAGYLKIPEDLELDSDEIDHV